MKIERKLIQDCSKGDRRAQKELYEICFAPMLSICYRFANNKDDAVILLNESFYRVIQNIDKQNESIPFFAWVKRITVNYCIDQYKKKNTRKHHLELVEDPGEFQDETVELDLDDDEGTYSKQMLEKVKEEILNLPPTTQEVFQLYALEGYSHAEIAEILEMKEGTSKWHVNNARKMLRDMIKSSLRLISSIAL